MDRHLVDLTKKVLEAGYLLSLATTDKDGVWVADVIYTFDDDCNLYWMSTPERRHSKAIAKNPRVAVAITFAQKPADPDDGLQISGTAEQINDIPFEIVKRYFRKRNKPEPAPTDDVLGEHLWYKLTPDRIELLYEGEFGYDRQTVK
jgi:uncharacterized protein YhbP (UPF0306 family)